MTADAVIESVDFVVPRYGPTVVGGAETLCRLMAENLAAHGTRVRVLTTCAHNHFTWANELPPGRASLDGVEVLRFPVGPRNAESWAGLHARLDLGMETTYADQIRWMANSVWSPELLDAMVGSSAGQWTIAMPYLFGTSFWAVEARPERTALIPCLHDEPHAYTEAVQASLAGAGGLIFNTRTERALAGEILSGKAKIAAGLVKNCPVVGVGYHPRPVPPRSALDAFLTRRGIKEGYLLYVGRREEAKGLPELFDLYAEYRRCAQSPKPLALVGSGDLPIPEEIAPFVLDLGFLPPEEMAAAYASALLLLHPSRLESLGMVLLECWMAGTPALVTAGGPVLVEHCRASGGGLWWTSSEDFTEAIEMLDGDPGVRGQMGQRGRDYVLTTFDWAAVRRRLLGALAGWS